MKANGAKHHGVVAVNGDQIVQMIKTHQVETGEPVRKIGFHFDGATVKVPVGFDGHMLTVDGQPIDPGKITTIKIDVV